MLEIFLAVKIHVLLLWLIAFHFLAAVTREENYLP
jgi:hypothetical protein